MKCQVPLCVRHAQYCATVALAGHSSASRKYFINMWFILVCFSGSFEVFYSKKEIFGVLITDIDLQRNMCKA